MPAKRPPRCAVFPIGIFPAIETSQSATNSPGIAYFAFIGIGMNITYIGRLGVNMIIIPAIPNIAPDAPTAKAVMSPVKMRDRSTKNNPDINPEMI